MLGVRLDKDLDMRLGNLAERTGRSKSHYVREAVRQYLEEREDYLLALAVLEREEPSIPLEELERRLGLAD